MIGRNFEIVKVELKRNPIEIEKSNNKSIFLLYLKVIEQKMKRSIRKSGEGKWIGKFNSPPTSPPKKLKNDRTPWFKFSSISKRLVSPSSHSISPFKSLRKVKRSGMESNVISKKERESVFILTLYFKQKKGKKIEGSRNKVAVWVKNAREREKTEKKKNFSFWVEINFERK